jgi:hypothetical protein
LRWHDRCQALVPVLSDSDYLELRRRYLHHETFRWLLFDLTAQTRDDLASAMAMHYGIDADMAGGTLQGILPAPVRPIRCVGSAADAPEVKVEMTVPTAPGSAIGPMPVRGQHGDPIRVNRGAPAAGRSVREGDLGLAWSPLLPVVGIRF